MHVCICVHICVRVHMHICMQVLRKHTQKHTRAYHHLEGDHPQRPQIGCEGAGQVVQDLGRHIQLCADEGGALGS